MGTRTITLELPEALVERLEKSGWLENTSHLTQVLESELNRQEEITDLNPQLEHFVAIRKQQHPDLPEKNLRQLAVLDLIEANREEGDDEWWQEFDRFLQENKWRSSKRNMDFDNE